RGVLRRRRSWVATRAVRVLQEAGSHRRRRRTTAEVDLMKVAAIQHDIVWEDPDANFARLAPLITDAATQGARLAVLTEMYSTGFSMAADRIAEPGGGRSTAFLVEQAARNDLWVCGSVPEVAAGDTKPSNCLVLAAPDGTILRYRKIHPFTFAGEHDHY